MSYSLSAWCLYLDVSLGLVLSFYINVFCQEKFESLSVQSSDCGNVVGVSQIVRHVRTWSKMRSVMSRL